MSVCVLQKPEKYRVLWTDFLGSWREINRFSVSKIGPEPAKPTISLALVSIFSKVYIFIRFHGSHLKVRSVADGRKDKVKTVYPPSNIVCKGYKNQIKING